MYEYFKTVLEQKYKYYIMYFFFQFPDIFKGLSQKERNNRPWARHEVVRESGYVTLHTLNLSNR